MNIKIQNLSKVYKGNICAIDNISLNIEKGLFGLLGRNGAGKTTLMRILATIIKPTSGDVIINGASVLTEGNKIRNELGYLPQEFGVYPNLTPMEFLDYILSLKGLKDKSARKSEIETLLERVGLEKVKNKKIKSFSGGMKQRVGIAQALLGNPKLIIVDEPTAGLDPEERVHFRNLLSEIGKDNTILLSTHIVSDIESACEKIGILKEGKLLYTGTIRALLNQMEKKVWETIVDKEVAERMKTEQCVISTDYTANGVLVRYSSSTRLSDKSKNVVPTLEDAYIVTMGGMNR